jgi:hypothetical protein
MKPLKIVLLVAGWLSILTGIVWIGQGTGYFPYPSYSFMIDQMPWAYRGMALAIAGLAAIWLSRRP